MRDSPSPANAADTTSTRPPTRKYLSAGQPLNEYTHPKIMATSTTTITDLPWVQLPALVDNLSLTTSCAHKYTPSSPVTNTTPHQPRRPHRPTSVFPSSRRGNPSPQVPSCSDAKPPNFGNDYSSLYARTGVLPQQHVQNVTEPLVGYPKLQQLHALKASHVSEHATLPVGLACKQAHMSKELERLNSAGAQFDVVMVGGCTVWPSVEALLKLPIAQLTPKPSLVFLWVPTTKLGEGRRILDAWGFRRAEDIVFMASREYSPYVSDATCFDDWSSPDRVFKCTTWHCLMGLKGTLRRSDDSDLINCNVDTDVIVEIPGQRANIVPEQIYSLIENFTNMSRRLHVIPTPAPEALPVRLRPGWAIVSPNSFISNLEPSHYSWRQVIPVHPEIDILRPRTPRRFN